MLLGLFVVKSVLEMLNKTLKCLGKNKSEIEDLSPVLSSSILVALVDGL